MTVVVFPLISAVLALLCAAVVGRDALRRPRADKVLWTLAFLMFGLAAGTDAFGREAGWSALLAKVYYATGPALVVMYLALGELYLLAPGRMKRFGIGITAILTAFWLSLVIGAPVDESRLAAEGWDAIERDGFMTAVTITINTLSTAIIVGGTGYTVWSYAKRGIMRNRMIGVSWILVGTLFVAAGGSLTRLGHYEYLYIAMSIGIAMIFYGVIWTRRPEGRAQEPIATGTEVEPRAAAMVPTVDAEPHADGAAPALAFLESILWRPVEELARTCEEWSVPADDRPVFAREEAREAWALRQEIPESHQQRFDALPVPQRRQLATLWREVLTWDGRKRDTPEADLPPGEPDASGG